MTPEEQSFDLPTIFDYIEKNRSAFIDRLCSYLRMPSISAHGIGIAEVGQYLSLIHI